MWNENQTPLWKSNRRKNTLRKESARTRMVPVFFQQFQETFAGLTFQNVSRLSGVPAKATMRKIKIYIQQTYFMPALKTPVNI